MGLLWGFAEKDEEIRMQKLKASLTQSRGRKVQQFAKIEREKKKRNSQKVATDGMGAKNSAGFELRSFFQTYDSVLYGNLAGDADNCKKKPVVAERWRQWLVRFFLPWGGKLLKDKWRQKCNQSCYLATFPQAVQQTLVSQNETANSGNASFKPILNQSQARLLWQSCSFHSQRWTNGFFVPRSLPPPPFSLWAFSLCGHGGNGELPSPSFSFLRLRIPFPLDPDSDWTDCLRLIALLPPLRPQAVFKHSDVFSKGRRGTRAEGHGFANICQHSVENSKC